VLRGTAQNPDAFFQAREACNPFYLAAPGAFQAAMDKFAGLTGRQYHLFDYAGHPQAERVIILMGSGAEVTHETVDYLMARGEKVGVVKVRLFRPFSLTDFIRALPPTVKAIAVLDRTKEPGALGEPLYLDVVTALHDARAEGVSPFRSDPVVIGGRYGLSSKEFTPGMVKAIRRVATVPKFRFTVKFTDVCISLESTELTQARLCGVLAWPARWRQQNSIKIIARPHRHGVFTTPRNPAPSPSRTSASARGPSGRPTWCAAPTSSPATSTSSSTATTCWSTRSRARCSCSTRRSARTRSGTICLGRCRNGS
jgi:hypothetical protein